MGEVEGMRGHARTTEVCMYTAHSQYSLPAEYQLWKGAWQW